MSKDQLKKLKDWRTDLSAALVLTGHEMSVELQKKVRNYRNLLTFAIEQAERVQDLEEENRRIRQGPYIVLYTDGLIDNVNTFFSRDEAEKFFEQVSEEYNIATIAEVIDTGRK